MKLAVPGRDESTPLRKDGFVAHGSFYCHMDRSTNPVEYNPTTENYPPKLLSHADLRSGAQEKTRSAGSLAHFILFRLGSGILLGLQFDQRRLGLVSVTNRALLDRSLPAAKLLSPGLAIRLGTIQERRSGNAA